MFYKIRDFLAAGILSLSYFFNVINWISGIAIHLYTTYFAFKFSGILAAFLSFIMPGISQIYWVIRMWSHTGNLSNYYSYNVFIYLAYLLIPLFLMLLASIIQPKK